MERPSTHQKPLGLTRRLEAGHQVIAQQGFWPSSAPPQSLLAQPLKTQGPSHSSSAPCQGSQQEWSPLPGLVRRIQGTKSQPSRRHRSLAFGDQLPALLLCASFLVRLRRDSRPSYPSQKLAAPITKRQGANQQHTKAMRCSRHLPIWPWQPALVVSLGTFRLCLLHLEEMEQQHCLQKILQAMVAGRT